MDHPPSPNQIDLSDATSKNNEVVIAGSSNPEDQPDPSHPAEGQANPEEEPPQAYAGQESEFGCKYCTKKFSSKQALGGHYNAHKAERALEKAARELHDIRFNLYNGGIGASARAAYNPQPYLGSYFRSHDRPVFNHFPFDNNPHQLGVRIDFHADPRLPLAGVPNAHGPRFHQFLGQSAYFMRNPGPHIWYPNIGTSSSRPVDPDLSVFAAPRHDPLDEDESGLDLSLKL